jgi:hypothetical protein
MIVMKIEKINREPLKSGHAKGDRHQIPLVVLGDMVHYI